MDTDQKQTLRNCAEYIYFSAVLNGQNVRLSVSFNDLDIVSRDNIESFDLIDSLNQLKNIEFEEIN